MDTIEMWFQSQGLNLLSTIFRLVIIAAIGILLIRLAQKLVRKVLEKSKLEKAAHSLILTLTSTLLYVLLGLIMASSIGIDVTGIVALASVATLAVLALCGLAIVRRFEGALPYLTTLIGALQAVTGVVLGAYFNKSKAENTKGGIVYDAALGVSNSDTDL